MRLRRGASSKAPTADEIKAFIRKLRPMATETKLIRLGPHGDGGYLVPDDLVGVEACFSPGVGLISGFEKDCADRDMRVFMADGSVEQPAETSAAFHFTQKHLGSRSRGDTITIDDWVDQSMSRSASDLLLQMDIEGAEFDVLIASSDLLLKRFRIIVIEFHDFHRLADRRFFERAAASVEKILRNHICVHIHPNNCCGSQLIEGIEVPLIAEFTFLRRDRIANPQSLSAVSAFPHPLDSDNVELVPYLPVPSVWYHSHD